MSAPIVFCVQRLLQKIWKELFSKLPLTKFLKPKAICILVYNSTCQFQVLSTHFEGLSPLSQQKASVDDSNLWKDEKGADNTSLDRLENTEGVLRNMTYLMLGRLYSRILNLNLYSKDEIGLR